MCSSALLFLYLFLFLFFLLRYRWIFNWDICKRDYGRKTNIKKEKKTSERSCKINIENPFRKIIIFFIRHFNSETTTIFVGNFQYINFYLFLCLLAHFMLLLFYANQYRLQIFHTLYFFVFKCYRECSSIKYILYKSYWKYQWTE